MGCFLLNLCFQGLNFLDTFSARIFWNFLRWLLLNWLGLLDKLRRRLVGRGSRGWLLFDILFLLHCEEYILQIHNLLFEPMHLDAWLHQVLIDADCLLDLFLSLKRVSQCKVSVDVFFIHLYRVFEDLSSLTVFWFYVVKNARVIEHHWIVRIEINCFFIVPVISKLTKNCFTARLHQVYPGASCWSRCCGGFVLLLDSPSGPLSNTRLPPHSCLLCRW